MKGVSAQYSPSLIFDIIFFMKNITDKNIEVEIRGYLTNEDYTRLNDFLSKTGTLKSKRERIFIDYSSSLEDRTKDIRIRETNGVSEIMIKLGNWGGSESREELSVTTGEKSFESLVRIFGELGHTKGTFCVRNSIVYDYNGVEFALVEVPNHSYYFEAEILTDIDHSVEADAKLRQVCESLGLKVFNKDEFFQYVTKLNTEANISFDYTKFKKGYFDNKEYLH